MVRRITLEAEADGSEGLLEKVLGILSDIDGNAGFAVRQEIVPGTVSKGMVQAAIVVPNFRRKEAGRHGC